MRRRFSAPLGILLMAAVPILIAVGLVIPTMADAAGEPLYPDLKVLPARELQFDRTDVSYDLDGLPSSIHNVLRFSTTVYNIGLGDLQVRAHIGASQSGAAFQRVFTTDGTFTDYNVGQIYYHAAHNHYHYDAWGEYQLWTKPDYDAWIASGRNPSLLIFTPGAKATACIMDEEFVIDVPGTDANPAYNGGNCYPDSNGNIVEGLSTGWGDTYDYYRPLQWFDLGQNGSLANGQYVVRSIADPTNLLHESPNKADASLEGELSNESTTIFSVQGGQPSRHVRPDRDGHDQRGEHLDCQRERHREGDRAR